MCQAASAKGWKTLRISKDDNNVFEEKTKEKIENIVQEVKETGGKLVFSLEYPLHSVVQVQRAEHVEGS